MWVTAHAGDTWASMRVVGDTRSRIRGIMSFTGGLTNQTFYIRVMTSGIWVRRYGGTLCMG